MGDDVPPSFIMYDPVKRAEEMARIVCRGDLRKYYRFRPARFYGGIATADSVGCCLRCIFCWSWHQVVRPSAYGRFFSPEAVAGKLVNIARKKGFDQVRISGNEPTISREHLLKVIEGIPGNIVFILETNGILIGHDETYAADLATFKNLYVRVSFKGATKEEFSALTGSSPEGFSLQLKALENLHRARVQVQPAVMVSFSPPDNIRAFQKRLGAIAPAFEHIEIEELVLYRDVEKRLQKANIRYNTAYETW
jgi:uncharacterized Fe-S cluster-containing radical SAM superfamily protein